MIALCAAWSTRSHRRTNASENWVHSAQSVRSGAPAALRVVSPHARRRRYMPIDSDLAIRQRLVDGSCLLTGMSTPLSRVSLWPIAVRVSAYGLLRTELPIR
jgi:hypothetical protein